MRKSSLFVAAGLALAAGLVASSPIGCGGGGGGLGLGIATLGISAAFPGGSPSWCAIDPTQKATDGTTAVIPTGTADDLLIGPGASIARCVIPGGTIFAPVTLAFTASGTAATTLTIEPALTTWDFHGDTVTFPTVTATITTTNTAISKTIDVGSPLDLGGHKFTALLSNPSDQGTFRFTNTGAGTVRIIGSSLKLSYTAGLTRMSEISIDGAGPSGQFRATEAIQGVIAQTVTPTSIQPVGTGVSLTAGVNQVVVLRVFVQGNNAPASGALVEFQASGSGGSPANGRARTDANGECASAVSFPATGTKSVTAVVVNEATGTPLLSAGQALFSIQVNTTPTARAFDGLESFSINVANGVSTTANQNPIVNVTTFGSNLAGQPVSTAQPTQITYVFVKDVTTAADWLFDLHVRTRSFAAAATCTFTVEVQGFAGNGNSSLEGTVPTGTAYRSDPLVATSVLQNFKGALKPVTPALQRLTFSEPLANYSNIGTLKVTFTVISSSDASAQGIEVITDSSAPSKLFFPGPVVFGRTPSVTAGQYMLSQPDPRAPGR